MIALIMAGGSGKRFWPLSRKSKPKQFLKIVSDEKTLIQMTYDRLRSRFKPEKIFVVTAGDQVDLIRKNIPFLPEENIIIEPFGMNTAPCLALSTAYISEFFGSNEVVVVLPSDHLIRDRKGFMESLQTASEAAGSDYLVTFGIKPDHPATGYGYIEAGKRLSEKVLSVTSFKEKPDLNTARDFISRGNYYWNSGMFVWKLETITKAFSDFLPEVLVLMSRIRELWQKRGYKSDISEIYRNMPFVPIDIGVMEKAENRAVVPVDIGWSDVGSWEAVYDISEKDEQGNVFKTSVFNISSRNNLVQSQKPVCLVGINNLVCIETDDVILISDKSKTENVKNLLEMIEKENYKELL